MKYRKLDPQGDYSFGQQHANFFKDCPEAVAQAVKTRLYLFVGEWFLDKTEGMPWRTEVLGKYTTSKYDSAIRQRILGTEGVSEITAYSSTADENSRTIHITATINTIYGRIPLEVTL